MCYTLLHDVITLGDTLGASRCTGLAVSRCLSVIPWVHPRPKNVGEHMNAPSLAAAIPSIAGDNPRYPAAPDTVSSRQPNDYNGLAMPCATIGARHRALAAAPRGTTGGFRMGVHIRIAMHSFRKNSRSSLGETSGALTVTPGSPRGAMERCSARVTAGSPQRPSRGLSVPKQNGTSNQVSGQWGRSRRETPERHFEGTLGSLSVSL